MVHKNFAEWFRYNFGIGQRFGMLDHTGEIAQYRISGGLQYKMLQPHNSSLQGSQYMELNLNVKED